MTQDRTGGAAHDVERACASALYAAARAAGAGSRQQVRAAVRRFLRRHRRDRPYLRQVLRAVLVSSALAVALLGLGASRAEAGATLFLPRTGAANPLAGRDAGSYSAPAFGDLDGDGDLDLVAGAIDGSLVYLENTGSASSPAFAPGTAGPFAGFDVGAYSAPTLGDLDADGDLDLVGGEADGGFFYFENVGDATSPSFVERTDSRNPLLGIYTGDMASPTLVDLDGDGDLDLVAGDLTGGFLYLANVSPTEPFFGPVLNSLAGLDVGIVSSPALGDVDGDGDLDLVCGDGPGGFHYFENTGDRSGDAFVERTGTANPLDGEQVPFFRARPALGDLDGDGDLDLVSGSNVGAFTTYYLPEPGRGRLLGAGLGSLHLLERWRRRRRGARERPR